jgi:ribosomal-protein-alanine N-acetyltransferase
MPESKLPAPIKVAAMSSGALPDVMAIESKSFALPWPEAFYRQELQNDRADFRVVMYNMKLVGYCGCWHMVNYMHVGTMAVHPTVRRRGIGELLLITIVDQAIELGVDAVRLEVRPSNHAAMSLYAKYGLVAVGRRSSYYPDTGEDAIIMTRSRMGSESYQSLFKAHRHDHFGRLARIWVDS